MRFIRNNQITKYKNNDKYKLQNIAKGNSNPWFSTSRVENYFLRCFLHSSFCNTFTAFLSLSHEIYWLSKKLFFASLSFDSFASNRQVKMELLGEPCDIDCSLDEPLQDIYESCHDGNLRRVKHLVEVENVNIYKVNHDFKTPLSMAISSKNQVVANLLLDVYERDLETLKGTKFTKALVAMAEDQTEELLKTVEEVPVDDNVVPVLLKTSNCEKPKLVYLRKILKNKDDSSLRMAKKLEDKNDFCDINSLPSHPNAITPLIDALTENMNQVVKRLLKFPTIDKNLCKEKENSPLKYAVLCNNVEAAEIISDGNPQLFCDEGFLAYSVRSRSVKMIEFVVKKIMGKFQLKEILQMNCHETFYKSPYKLFHEICRYGYYEYFMEHQLPFDEDDFCVQDDYGDTILHFLLRFELKNDMLKVGKLLIDKYPRLLTTRNKRNFLPLHDAVRSECVLGLIELIHDETVKVMKSEEVFCEDIEVAVSCLEGASSLFVNEHDIIESFLEKLLNGKLQNILESHGTRLLHQYILKSPYHGLRSLKFLLAQKKVQFDLNECYNGVNAYIEALRNENNIGKSDALKVYRALHDYQPVDDYNAKDTEGKTIFMYLCEFGEDLDVIKTIIAKCPGCTTKKTQNGSTCFHFVHRNFENSKIVEVLVKNFANPQQENDIGQVPVMQALNSNNSSIFEALLDLMAEEEINKRYGSLKETLLHAEMKTFESTTIEKVLMRNVDFTVTDVNGNTPLHVVVSIKSYRKYLNHFLSQHIPVDLNIPEAKTCVKSAITETLKHMKTAIMKLIKSDGTFTRLDINQQNNDGDTPLHILLGNTRFDDQETIEGNYYEEATKTLLTHFNDQIDFAVKNKNGETITHKLVKHYSFEKFTELFEYFPKLHQAFQNQIDVEDHNKITPIKCLIQCWQQDRQFEMIINNVDFEKIKKNFQLFIDHTEGLKLLYEKYPQLFDESCIENLLNSSLNQMENNEAFDYLLTKISNEALAKVCKDDKNVLHLICLKNDAIILDSTIKFFSENQLKKLSEENDGKGRKPFDLLNDDNKVFFNFL